MNTQNLVAKIAELAAIPSTDDRPDALRDAIEYVANMLAENPAITIERFTCNGKPSLLAYYGNTRPAKFDVILHGHVDVVAAPDEQFTPRVENGRLYGRGAHDMKSGMIALVEVFRTKGQHSPLVLGLQVVADEEIGGYDCVVAQLEAGVTADFVITGEMTDNHISNETRGLCWVEVSFAGKTAHGAYVWAGDNALSKASNVAQKVLAAYPTPTEQSWCTTANVAAISSDNDTFNKVPGAATVKIDLRFVPEDPVFKDEESVTAFIRQFAPDAEVSFVLFEPAVCVPQSNKYLQRLQQAFREANGIDTTLMRRYGSSDARHYALAGIPCVEFGPGGGNHHADDEFLEIDSLEPYVAALEAFIAKPRP